MKNQKNVLLKFFFTTLVVAILSIVIFAIKVSLKQKQQKTIEMLYETLEMFV